MQWCSMSGRLWLMRLGSMGPGLTGWAYPAIPSQRYSVRSLPWEWITGRHFSISSPGFSLDAERARRADAGQPEWFGEDDLYPDVRPCMAALRDMGVWVGVAGNQTSRAGEILRKLDLPADLIATSEDWGASKPDQSFFRALISAAPCEASRIVYVGDRLDNDLKPAKAAGMRTAFIRRGPWGYIWEHHPDMAAAADWRMASLAELPPLVAEVNRSER